jgi:hypothetical protein
MKIRQINWPLWAGFLLSVIAFFSYFLFFVRFPVTRDFPWANLLLFGLAGAILVVGLRRAFVPAPSSRGKISAPILATLSVAVFAFFGFSVFVASKHLPPAHGSPQLGQKAPAFTLLDTSGKSVSLAELLSAPLPGHSGDGRVPRGVLLVFYRGYW